MFKYTVQEDGQADKVYEGFTRYNPNHPIPFRATVDTSLVIANHDEIDLWMVQVGMTVHGLAALRQYYKDRGCSSVTMQQFAVNEQSYSSIQYLIKEYKPVV